MDALLVKGSQHNTNTGCWQWRDDRGLWHNYMWVDNRILETAHQSGEDEISLSTLGRNYIIDFTNSQQVFNLLVVIIFIFNISEKCLSFEVFCGICQSI